MNSLNTATSALLVAAMVTSAQLSLGCRDRAEEDPSPSNPSGAPIGQGEPDPAGTAGHESLERIFAVPAQPQVFEIWDDSVWITTETVVTKKPFALEPLYYEAPPGTTALGPLSPRGPYVVVQSADQQRLMRPGQPYEEVADLPVQAEVLAFDVEARYLAYALEGMLIVYYIESAVSRATAPLDGDVLRFTSDGNRFYWYVSGSVWEGSWSGDTASRILWEGPAPDVIDHSTAYFVHLNRRSIDAISWGDESESSRQTFYEGSYALLQLEDTADYLWLVHRDPSLPSSASSTVTRVRKSDGNAQVIERELPLIYALRPYNGEIYLGTSLGDEFVISLLR